MDKKEFFKYAKENNIIKLCEMADQYDIDVDLFFDDDYLERNVLHIAASRGFLDMVKIAIEKYGVNINGTDICELRAIDYADENGHYNVVEYLLQNGIMDNLKEDSKFLTSKFPEVKLFSKSINSYEDLYNFSIENNEEFWRTLALNRLEWFKEFDKVNNGLDFNDYENYEHKWFINGKINVSVNCVDRHYKKNPNKTAVIWDKDEPGTEQYVTYSELYKLMNKFSNMIRHFNVKKGDSVIIYLPTSLYAIAAMLACARIGAVHSVVFGGFSSESLASRIQNCQAKIVITSNQGVRGGRFIEFKQTVDTAIETCPFVEHVLVYKRTDNPFQVNKDKDIIIDDIIDTFPDECEPEIMDSNDPLFILFTSGSTGKPKGLVHSNAGYLLQASLTQQLVFNYDCEKDVFGCLADIGWITGHSYVVYGTLCNGGTTVLFESTPTYPDPSRYWQTVERLKINQLYLAPTAIRLLIKHGDEWLKKHDKSSLKCLGSVGEPINVEAWNWFYEKVGEKRCKIADTWWQTETGAHCITPLPCGSNDILKPGMAMRPFFGIQLALMDQNGNESDTKHIEGMLCIKKPWPSMAMTVFGDDQRFKETYLKPYRGYFFTGDGAFFDNDGHIKITGRVDDVMNVSGHRIGTAEIENILSEHPDVAESAVVGVPHELTGEAVFAYIVLKETQKSEQEIFKQLKNLVKKKIASHAIPNTILVTPNLPKTRSGKIMRRILRKIASNQIEDLGDLSTISESNVIEEIIQSFRSMSSK
ncbi:unnamed protein product [Brachionus calyciflorus]|uniref:Acetyl-coenzyme A synthetase n=1 Tax=Brachionus calyciflorus TaxID=104777 RepID=A0A814CAF6_9BILA|nr:unnamed protein product [Brachionus calyciflorus]